MKIQILKISNFFQLRERVFKGEKITPKDIEIAWGGFYESETAPKPETIWDAINWTAHMDYPPDNLHIVGEWGGCCADVIFYYPDSETFVLTLSIGFRNVNTSSTDELTQEIIENMICISN